MYIWKKILSLNLFLLLSGFISAMYIGKNSTSIKAIEERQTAPVLSSKISWLKEWIMLRHQMQNCVKLTKDTSWNCFKLASLRIFDDVMTAPIIPLGAGIRFVLIPRAKDQKTANDTQDHNNESKRLIDSYDRQDLKYLTWFDRLALRLAKTMTTHMLQVNLKQLTDSYMRTIEKQKSKNKLQINSTGEIVGTARYRRHRYNMMITMMFGATALGAVLVPMGFQLLSIVSGKALLLAKMALLLASINGLKRVANSGIHYGLYHVPGEHYGGYYDRGDAHHPRNVANIAIAQPEIELGIRK